MKISVEYKGNQSALGGIHEPNHCTQTMDPYP